MRIYLMIFLLMIGLVTFPVRLVGEDEYTALSCDFDAFFQREFASLSARESSESIEGLKVEFSNLRILLPDRYMETSQANGRSSYFSDIPQHVYRRESCGPVFWVSGMIGSGMVESCISCTRESFNPKTWGRSISSSKSHFILERESEDAERGIFLIAVISESDTKTEEFERYESDPLFGVLAYDENEYIRILDPNGYWLRSVYEQIENAFWPEDANGTN
ncbi:hypothetical protein [Aliidiomarina celeris]|uniref:hypothetical protein n=1 Tax=Aliidiomarina celeris TaxID=2249428 RepID=UPI000DEB189C|nr:hypothetical protein [Aliidiomarina celeris]